MILSSVVLFLTVLITGLVIKSSVENSELNTKSFLIFGGSYLFSITIIHLLPNLFIASKQLPFIPVFILIGFFLQLILELFSQGAEHGHIHWHKDHPGLFAKPLFLLLSLSIHAFLEGTLFINSQHFDFIHDTKALLIGVILHKIPVTIALVAIIKYQLKKNSFVLIYLLIFAFASPFGIFTGNLLDTGGFLNEGTMLIIFAIVSGNFLHISTTIFFETNPEHLLNIRKILIALSGAIAAILTNALI